MRSLPGSLSIPIQRQPSGTRSAGPSPTPSPTTYRSGAAADLVRSGPLSPLVYSRLTRPRGGAAGSPNSPTSSRAHTADETFVSLLGRVSGAAVPAFPSPKGALRSPGSQGADAPAAAEDAPEAAPAPAEARRPRLDTQFVFPPHLAESYELIAPVGSGAFGTVWHAVHIESGEQVAIKVIERKKQLVEDFRLELNEAEILKSIAHPNIVRLKELASEPSGSDAFLIMELVDGGHLQAQLDEHGAYSDAEAVAIFRQVVSAIGYLHERNITHRDIKPENLVLMSANFLKLIDFGTAIMLAEGEEVISGGRCGTTGYWAPEQLAQKPYGHAVDLWAAGVLLYILLSGFHPFDPDGDASAEELKSSMLAGKYSFASPEWRTMSKEAKGLLKALLEPDPSKRLTAAELVNHPWVRGERVSNQPLPETHERLRAYTKARHAFHGSILIGILMHQMRQSQAQMQADQEEVSKGVKEVHPIHADPEGGGAGHSDDAVDALRVGFQLFDAEEKGHITAADLRRVSFDLGFEVTERELNNMMAVLAPTGQHAPLSPSGAGAAAQNADKGERTISFESYSRALNKSFSRAFRRGQRIFRQGDEVDGFYIITRGTCAVLVRPKSGSEVEIAKLGPGDFFGETGILEGRAVRSSSVECISPVEVLFMDKAEFSALVQSDRSGTLKEDMHRRAEARQQARMSKLITALSMQVANQLRLKPGESAIRQGDRADAMFQLVEGRLRQSFTAETGEAVGLGTIEPGAYFGYDALLSGVHDVTVTAETNVTLARLPMSALKPAIEGSEWLESTMKVRADRLHVSLTTAEKAAASGRSESQILATMATVAASAGEPMAFDHWQQMVDQAEPLVVREGREVFSQGDVPTHVYFIDVGRLQLHYKTEKGANRILAELGPGDHFGETAFLDGRSARNTTVTCTTSPRCELRRIGRAEWEAAMAGCPQLSTAVREAAMTRSRSRLRTIIDMAARSGKAETVMLPRGATVFAQGDPAGDFYIVKSGTVEMSYQTPEGANVPTKTYGIGECFGASGALGGLGVPPPRAAGQGKALGSGTRRNTATALEPVELYKVPHRHMRLLIGEDTNAMSSFENVLKQRALMQRQQSFVIDKIHLRDEEAFMHKQQPPREAFEED
mmetsp:Transcript_34773/g.86766  ORF Transcript_34773/g.86766 Transcript_34773/m.86766 type:complete len:1133 (+) Transcript_34773:61-3459(+)